MSFDRFEIQNPIWLALRMSVMLVAHEGVIFLALIRLYFHI